LRARRLLPVLASLGCCLWAASVCPPHATATPQEFAAATADTGGWMFTGQVGAGLTFYWGEQSSDPAFSFAAGRFVSDTLQVEGQLLAIPGSGPPREFSWVDSPGDLTTRSTWTVQRRMLLALTRLNLYLGEGRVRPYFSFGAGPGWASEGGTFSRQRVDASGNVSAEEGTQGEQGIGFATLLGTGIDIGVTEHWRARPEVTMPVLWGRTQPGNVILAVGITYTSRPPTPRRAAYVLSSHEHAGESAAAAWRRVTTIYSGGTLRVRLKPGTWTQSDGVFNPPSSTTLLASFVSADDKGVVVNVIEGASGTFRIPRNRVQRIERGRFESNGPWEGVLGGFVFGATLGAFGYLGSGGGDDHEIWIPVGTIMFGGPAALVGGLADHFHRSFEAVELIYDTRLIAPAGGPR